MSHNNKFKLGKVVITKNAWLSLDMYSVQVILQAHYANGNWGDLCDEDKKLNDEAIEYGDRILAAYSDVNGTKFWIITESDRSYTTVLLPEDY